MASNTQKFKRVRARKNTQMGKTRKRLVRANGTTPKFAIHTDKPGTREVDVTSLHINENE